MILFEDFFDYGLAEYPYQDSRAHIRDRIALVRLLLKGLSEQRRIEDDGQPGTVKGIDAWISAPEFPDETNRSMAESAKEEAAAALEFIKGREKASADQPTAGMHLSKKFALDDYTELALYLALAPELSTSLLPVFGYLQGENTPARPTAYLLEELYRYGFGEPPVRGRRLFDDETDGALLFCHPKNEPALSELMYPLQLHRSVIAYLTDGGSFPENRFALPLPDKDLSLFFEKEASALTMLTTNRKQQEGAFILYIECPDYRDAQQLLREMTVQSGQQLCAIDAAGYASAGNEEARNAMAELLVTSRLDRGMLAFFDESEDAAPARKLLELPVARRFCRETFIFGSKKLPAAAVARDGWIPYSLPIPELAKRREVWEYCMENTIGKEVSIAEDVDTYELAYCYEISVSSIKSACLTGMAAALSEEQVLTRAIFGDTLFQAGVTDFGELAKRITPSYGWDDLEIEKSQRDILKVAIDRFRVRSRLGPKWGLDKKNAYGNGVSLILYGPPGTGKTMASQVIAKELGLPLFRVDLSQMFSKYIGETSKNLAKVFTEASKSNVILFFDEADALFAKRTEVSDSLDKHANAETAYLLQRIEEYRGFSILATNYYQNFDKAFVRRITYGVHLDSPSAEERLKLWLKTLPKTVPMVEGIDFEMLAENLELSGSNIKSILYSAAYIAGAEEKKVGPSHIARALKYEYDKLGKMLDFSDLGPYAGYVL